MAPEGGPNTDGAGTSDSPPPRVSTALPATARGMSHSILPYSQPHVVGKKQVEDYRPGYPRFAAIIGAHAPFHISQRFSRLRSRLLLLKQDEISVLEAQLDAVDEAETNALYLGNRRRDRNEVRKRVVDEISLALRDYDELLERNHRVLKYEAAQRWNLASLQNWTEATGSVARAELAYLDKADDLLCLATQTDDILVCLELLLERAVIWVAELFGMEVRCGVSRDPNVYIFSGTAISRTAHALVAWLVILLLLIPVIAINALESTLLRLILIVLAAAMAVMLFAVLTRARTWEMFLAGATYSAVLVVFVAGTGLGTPNPG
ncbi:hypothetical protein B0T25DRAFT_554244 [Lasiosphaeria hispida]|uniref:DUF6594 domain-containing protein n=1 Tax=Lasiosphaeria hispida TaxID=260671 RepID=A0AAJ0H7U3_9PEZI|nr:hypothetical protein B0T25DRAFT_554244 [Lasiosphaeria hispida]